MCGNSKLKFIINIGAKPKFLTKFYWRHLLACIPPKLAYLPLLMAYIPLCQHIFPLLLKCPSLR